MSTFYRSILYVCILFSFPLFCAPKLLTFQELSKTEKIENLTQINDLLQTFVDQEVEIHGFLYNDQKGHYILSSEPNLSTCCVGGSHKVHGQIFINEISNVNPESLPSTATTINGVFALSPIKDDSGELKQLFTIKTATMTESEFSKWFTALLILIGVGLIATLMCRLIRKIRKGK